MHWKTSDLKRRSDDHHHLSIFHDFLTRPTTSQNPFEKKEKNSHFDITDPEVTVYGHTSREKRWSLHT